MSVKLEVGKCYEYTSNSMEYLEVMNYNPRDTGCSYLCRTYFKSDGTTTGAIFLNENSTPNYSSYEYAGNEIPNPFPVVTTSQMQQMKRYIDEAVQLTSLYVPATRKCDCGGEMTKMPHFSWCSINNKKEEK